MVKWLIDHEILQATAAALFFWVPLLAIFKVVYLG